MKTVAALACITFLSTCELLQAESSKSSTGGGNGIDAFAQAKEVSRAAGSFVAGVHREKEWVYGFLERDRSAAESGYTGSSDKSVPIYSDEEWIVTKKLVPDGTGFASSKLSFYDARSLRLEQVVTVPNDVFHADRSVDRDQFLVVTACGLGSSSSCLPHDIDQALVLVDLHSRTIERIQIWEHDEYHLQWNGECAPRWAGNSIKIPIPESPERRSNADAKPRSRAFQGIQLRFLPSNDPSIFVLSSSKRDDPSLTFAGFQSSFGNSGKRDPGLCASDSVIGSVQRDASEHTMFVRFRNDSLDLINLSELSSETRRVQASPLDGIGLLRRGIVWLLSNNQLLLSSDSRVQNIDLAKVMGVAVSSPSAEGERTYATRSIFPDVRVSAMRSDNMQCDASSEAIYVARHDGETIQIQKFTDAGDESKETIAVPEAIKAHQWAKLFTIDAKRRSLAFVVGDNASGRQWLEIDWATGRPVAPAYADESTHGMQSADRLLGHAPPGWLLASSLTGESKWGARSSLVEATELQSGRTFSISEGPHRHFLPLALDVTDPGRTAFVVSAGELAARVEKFDLSNGDVRLEQEWSWMPGTGVALYESLARRLWIPRDFGYRIYLLGGQGGVESIADMILGPVGKYAILLPNGTYAGSPGCESLLRLRAGDGSVDGTSIAQWRNRPAEVLKALGGDLELIDVLAKVTERWQKRIGFDPAKPEPKASDLPKVSVPERPPLWAQGEEAVFTIRWEKSASPLKDIIVRVNGVESARFEGDTLPAATEAKGSVDATVKLAGGQNWIEVTAEDVEGRRSDLQRFRTILKDLPTETKRYIIALGVSDYAKPELNLQFAAKDAKDLLEALAGKSAAGTGLLAKMFGQSANAQGSDQILLLTNDQVNRSAVEKIREFVGTSTESDEVILFCAGHGVLDDKLDYYYAGHDFDPERPAETGIKLYDLVGAVSSAKALKRLVLLDTCHAGVVGEKDEMLLAQMDTKLPSGVRAVAQRGMKVQQAADFTASDKQRFIEEMFSLPGTIRGVNIIGASAGAQFALESDKWNNGVFTASVIEGLRDKKADWNQDGRINVSELKNYLGQRVAELTAGAQKPSVVAFEQDQDFNLLN